MMFGDPTVYAVVKENWASWLSLCGALGLPPVLWGNLLLEADLVSGQPFVPGQLLGALGLFPAPGQLPVPGRDEVRTPGRWQPLNIDPVTEAETPVSDRARLRPTSATADALSEIERVKWKAPPRHDNLQDAASRLFLVP